MQGFSLYNAIPGGGVRVRVRIRGGKGNNTKPVFHFNRIEAKRNVFYCVHIISSI